MLGAGAVRGGSRFTFLVRRWPSPVSCLFPKLGCLGSSAGPLLAGRYAHNGKGYLVMRITGTVKFFNGAKGFGFIAPEDGSKDVFVHATALERAGLRTLNEGDKVTFVLEDDRKGRGKQAAQIEKA
jgi:CspA family cold shock protein